MIVVIIVLSLLISIFSYTFVDLNLTILNWSPYLAVQQAFTQLGYFNRPLNGLIQLLLLTATTVVYPFICMRKWDFVTLRNTILMISLILTCGYNAYSHDLFNYMFDARMITRYGDNPYIQKALDYPQDDWIRFMQWTHRTYPYGPTWLLITVVPSWLGWGTFLPTYFLFKILFLSAYLLGAWSIYHIIKSTTQQESTALKATALFAGNPLVLIEGVLSPHLDIVMASLGLLSVLLIVAKRPVISLVTLLFSAGIKFATLPWVLITNTWFIHRFNYKVFSYALVGMSLLLSIAQAISQSNYQPWYGLLPAAVLPLLTPYVKMKYLVVAGILIALPMWIYVYFAYTGQWTSAIPLF